MSGGDETEEVIRVNVFSVVAARARPRLIDRCVESGATATRWDGRAVVLVEAEVACDEAIVGTLSGWLVDRRKL